MSDEAFHQRGLTHLIEHMSLHDVDRGIAHNGSVDLTNTLLHCSGPLGDVQRFFQIAMHGLNNLPYHDLERESRVLAAESARRPHSSASEALAIMYGYAGPGMIALPEAGLHEVTPEKVEAWRQRYFVKENAAAFFHGPRPEGISFAELATGQRAPHTSPRRILEATPLFHANNSAGPAMFTPFERGTAGLIVAVAQDRLTQKLRGEMGVSYDVSASLTELAPDLQWLTIGADAATPEHNSQTFDTMRVELDRLASDGPSSEEIQFLVGQKDRAERGEFGDLSKLDAVSKARFFVEGKEFREYPAIRADLVSMTTADFAAPLQQALAAPLWVVPFDTRVADARLAPAPGWSQSRAIGERFESKYSDIWLEFSESMLSLCVDEERVITSEHGAISGVLRYTDGGVAIHTNDGFTLRTVCSDFDAEASMAAFIAGVSSELVISTAEPLRSEEAKANLVPKQQPGWKDKLKNKGNKKRRRGEEHEERLASDRPLGMPDYRVVMGHSGAVEFSQAIINGQWAVAEDLYSRASTNEDRQHLVIVASQTGGRPDRLDPWVEGSVKPGLALMMRGEMGMTWAWDARTSQRAEQVSPEMFQEFWARLRAADVDLLAATKELPDSPVPWVSLLTTARGLQIPKAEAEERYINHVQRGALLEGHYSFQQFVCHKWFGSHDEMWEHAEFVCDNAADGSVALSVASMALVEHWLSEANEPDSIYEYALELLTSSGKKDFVLEAQRRAYSHPSFPVATPHGLRALEAMFTSYLMSEHIAKAASLITPIGDRYTNRPYGYFQDVSWPVFRESVRTRAEELSR